MGTEEGKYVDKACLNGSLGCCGALIPVASGRNSDMTGLPEDAAFEVVVSMVIRFLSF